MLDDETPPAEVAIRHGLGSDEILRVPRGPAAKGKLSRRFKRYPRCTSETSTRVDRRHLTSCQLSSSPGHFISQNKIEQSLGFASFSGCRSQLRGYNSELLKRCDCFRDDRDKVGLSLASLWHARNWTNRKCICTVGQNPRKQSQKVRFRKLHMNGKAPVNWS